MTCSPSSHTHWETLEVFALVRATRYSMTIFENTREVYKVQTQSVESIAHHLKQAQDQQRDRFILFLGAGASDSSGIPIASSMVRDFKRELTGIWESEQRPHDVNFKSWLEAKAGWQRNEGPYAKYFESLEPTEYGRTLYLNKWMQAASPGWGYFCLAQLLAKAYFSTVVTTNFDDLIYEACTLYSVKRPRVYSAFSPYTSFEHDHERPTIIKLHGDYLYANFRTTTEEVKAVDRRLMNEVSTLFAQHEIIVVGYSGTDDRIMKDLFATMPPRNGVYWCTYKDESMPDSVLSLLSSGNHDEETMVIGDRPSLDNRRHQHWFQIPTKGFDEFMDVLLNKLKFNLPGITQPMQALIDAIPARIEGSDSRYALQYIDEAIQQLQSEEDELTCAYKAANAAPRTPYRLRLEAMNARLKRQYDQAVVLYELLTSLPNQDTCEVLIECAVTLELMGKYAKALELTAKIEKQISKVDDLGNYGWLLANLGKYKEGIEYFRLAIKKGPGLRQWRTALAMILSEDAQVDGALKFAKELTDIFPMDGPMWATRSMIHSLKGDYAPEAMKYAETAVKLNATGFVENLSLAFAFAGTGNYQEAISALDAIEEGDDDIRYRSLGHFQMLVNDSTSAIRNLKKAAELNQPALRPKTMVLYGIALMSYGNREGAETIFRDTSKSRDSGRHYKLDDELAFALCDLGHGDDVSGASCFTELWRKCQFMRGLFSEYGNLLRIMKDGGVEGCDQCLSVLDESAC